MVLSCVLNYFYNNFYIKVAETLSKKVLKIKIQWPRVVLSKNVNYKSDVYFSAATVYLGDMVKILFFEMFKHSKF